MRERRAYRPKVDVRGPSLVDIYGRNHCVPYIQGRCNQQQCLYRHDVKVRSEYEAEMQVNDPTYVPPHLRHLPATISKVCSRVGARTSQSSHKSSAYVHPHLRGMPSTTSKVSEGDATTSQSSDNPSTYVHRHLRGMPSTTSQVSEGDAKTFQSPVAQASRQVKTFELLWKNFVEKSKLAIKLDLSLSEALEMGDANTLQSSTSNSASTSFNMDGASASQSSLGSEFDSKSFAEIPILPINSNGTCQSFEKADNVPLHSGPVEPEEWSSPPVTWLDVVRAQGLPDWYADEPLTWDDALAKQGILDTYDGPFSSKNAVNEESSLSGPVPPEWWYEPLVTWASVRAAQGLPAWGGGPVTCIDDFGVVYEINEFDCMFEQVPSPSAANEASSPSGSAPPEWWYDPLVTWASVLAAQGLSTSYLGPVTHIDEFDGTIYEVNEVDCTFERVLSPAEEGPVEEALAGELAAPETASESPIQNNSFPDCWSSPLATQLDVVRAKGLPDWYADPPITWADVVSPQDCPDWFSQSTTCPDVFGNVYVTDEVVSTSQSSQDVTDKLPPSSGPLVDVEKTSSASMGDFKLDFQKESKSGGKQTQRKSDSTLIKKKFGGHQTKNEVAVIPTPTPYVISPDQAAKDAAEWERTKNLEGVYLYAFFYDGMDRMLAGAARLDFNLDIHRHLLTCPSTSLRSIDESSKPRLHTLPVEIRRMIWKYALEDNGHTSRLIFRRKTTYRGPTKPQIFNVFTNRTSAPALLHVNTETRELALQYYKKAFGTQTADPQLYFNFEIDRVFLRIKASRTFQNVVECILPEERERLKHVIIPLKIIVVEPDSTLFATVIAMFKGLKVLEMYMGDGPEDVFHLRGVKHYEKLIRGSVESLWKKLNPGTAFPKVQITLIPWEVAAKFGIDEFQWI